MSQISRGSVPRLKRSSAKERLGVSQRASWSPTGAQQSGSGWWWTDALAALTVAGFALRKGAIRPSARPLLPTRVRSVSQDRTGGNAGRLRRRRTLRDRPNAYCRPVPYLAVYTIVFGVNLLPAFGPPSWAVTCVHPTALAPQSRGPGRDRSGGGGGSRGVITLALGARHFSTWLPQRMKDDLECRAVLEPEGARQRSCEFLIFVVCSTPFGSALSCRWVPGPRPPLVHFGVLRRPTGELFHLHEFGRPRRSAIEQRPRAALRIGMVDRTAGRAPRDRVPSSARQLAPRLAAPFVFVKGAL